MIGIVIVSHSQKIAQGTRELALQMAPTAQIAAAGGMKDGGIGTDVEAIIAAIDSVYSEDGVIVLVDLGSAVMSSEMAIELLDHDENIKIVDAPIVEGAVFGAVESVVGASMERMLQVFKEMKSYKKV